MRQCCEILMAAHRHISMMMSGISGRPSGKDIGAGAASEPGGLGVEAAAVPAAVLLFYPPPTRQHLSMSGKTLQLCNTLCTEHTQSCAA